MSERVLTIDLGNSRCKLVLWKREGLARPGPRTNPAALSGSPPEPPPEPPPGGLSEPLDERELSTPIALSTEPFARFLDDWLPRTVDIARIGLSSVAALSGEQTLATTLRARFGDRFVERPDPGLDNACLEPERVGRDRLFAARGALEIVGGAAIVVDAGTALTVDALSFVDARARFEGGAIAPGPRLLADALVRHAARLPLIEPVVGSRALGRDTEAALQSGVVVGFRGAARTLAREVARESGLEGVPIVVTGGARAFLLQPEPCFEGRVVEDRFLVHRGMLAALDEHVAR